MLKKLNVANEGKLNESDLTESDSCTKEFLRIKQMMNKKVNVD